MVVVLLRTVVKAGIDKNVGGKEAVDLQHHIVLPFHFRTLVGGVEIKARAPLHVRGELVGEVDVYLRTVVMQLVLALVESIAGGQ